MALVEVEEVDGGVQVVRLNRPERKNALSGELVEALIQAIQAAEANSDVRVLVLVGADGTFCAGGDLAGGLGSQGGAVAAHKQRQRFADLLGHIMKSALVVIAAVEGAAMGGGLGLAVACDLVFAGNGARLGTPEIKLGLFPWIILAVLQRNVGRKHLMELIFTGERITAERAVELGLINHAVPDGDALERARAMGLTIAARAPVAIALGKQTFQAVADQSLDDAMLTLNGQLTLNLLTEDAMEGVAAFLQRREPTWKGR